MKTVNSSTIFTLIVLALTLGGCSSATIKTNADQEFPIPISASNPALIFPISLHGVPGDKFEIGLSISSGIVAQYGASVISGQQLYSQVGNLSWTLGENMRRQVKKGSLEMTGSAEKYANELDTKMKSLTGKLKSAGLIKDPNYNFKYVIVLHVDSASGPKMPFVKKVTAFGGIMDLETMNIVSYIEKDLTLSEDAVLAQMPAEMNKIVAELLDPKA